jgi:hypothetical protein
MATEHPTKELTDDDRRAGADGEVDDAVSSTVGVDASLDGLHHLP